MRILFLCMDNYYSFSERGTYTDIMRTLIKRGHTVIGISPDKNASKCTRIEEGSSMIIKPGIGMGETGAYIKKGLSMVLIPKIIEKAINETDNLGHIDAVIYATPPVTIAGLIKKLKKRYNATAYLLLKDMWPQVMIDAKLLSKHGIKGLLYKYFAGIEKRLYKISDCIGCMSDANVQYLIEHHKYISPEKVHVSPNSLEPRDYTFCDAQKSEIRKKYGIPEDKIVFLYGGNLGILQGVDFLVKCLQKCTNEKCFFVICGTGTHQHLVQEFIKKENPDNVLFINGLIREDFDNLTKSCDIGLATLAWTCTTPNFPSKILPYMEYNKPVLICSDTVTDIGRIAHKNKFGWFCPGNNAESFAELVGEIASYPLEEYGNNARKYLEKHYTAEISGNIIIREIEAAKAGKESAKK